MDLASILGRFWTDLGAPGEPKWTLKSKHLEGNSGPAPRIPQGRLWGRFWEVLGGFRGGFGRFWKDFKGNPSESSESRRLLAMSAATEQSEAWRILANP